LYEHWLTLGGVDLGVRGALFEQYVRERCIDAIAESRLLRHVARCAGGQIEISATAGDMDVVCLLGNTVIVAECKCTTTPATAVERSNYFAVLHDAADQVSRKIAYASTHVDELSVATGWTLNNPRFVGIVVTDQEVGVGQLITGVPVVDCLILTKYLHEGFLEHGVLFEDDGTKRVMRTIAFYESADDAEGKLMDYLLAPPQLWTALRSAKIRESPLLVAPGERPAAYRSFEVDMSTERRQRNQSSADKTTDSK
jgi:hypothetical protein